MATMHIRCDDKVAAQLHDIQARMILRDHRRITLGDVLRRLATHWEASQVKEDSR